MKLGRTLGSIALGLGGIIAANRTLRQRPDDLEPPLSGEQQRFRWRGIDVAYTEAGDPDNRDLVLLHGINAAGSSGEFRAIFDDLAEAYHVIAPDAPGYGRSDRPPLKYSPALYEDFIADFLATFDEPAVIASSLTGSYAAVAARETPVSSLLLVCPTTTGGPEPPKGWLFSALRSPVLGEALFNLVVSKPAIRYFNADHGYYSDAYPEREWETYEWQTTHQPNARFAPASFIAGYLNTDVDLGATLRSLDVPVTLVWGRESTVTPLSDGRDLAEAADATLVVFDDTMLLPHVEFAAQFVDVTREHIDAV